MNGWGGRVGRGVKVRQNDAYKDLLKKLIFLESKKDFISFFYVCWGFLELLIRFSLWHLIVSFFACFSEITTNSKNPYSTDFTGLKTDLILEKTFKKYHSTCTFWRIFLHHMRGGWALEKNRPWQRSDLWRLFQHWFLELIDNFELSKSLQQNITLISFKNLQKTFISRLSL
jgi:hypothetical protein